MLFIRNKSYEDIVPALETKTLIMLVKKLLPDVVFNMANLEGNPFTYPEVQTLLDGITIGGHKIIDEQQIYSIRNGWNYFNIKRQGIFNIKAKDRLQFNTLMVEFYNTREADNMFEFLYHNCLERY